MLFSKGKLLKASSRKSRGITPRSLGVAKLWVGKDALSWVLQVDTVGVQEDK